MVFNRKSEPKPIEGGATLSPGHPGAGPDAAGGPDPQLAESVIGNDLTIEGQSITIRCQGSLHVNGTIQADLHSAFLIVGEAATITGAIAANRVDVLGRVYGAIRGAHVVLHPSAQVEGDIHSQMLSVQQGASFDGRSRRVTDPREIAPELEPATASAPAAAPASPAQLTAPAEPAAAGQGPRPFTMPMPGQRLHS
jgi:cytoskeletal protein CcmA (bactofilin family)